MNNKHLCLLVQPSSQREMVTPRLCKLLRRPDKLVGKRGDGPDSSFSRRMLPDHAVLYVEINDAQVFRFIIVWCAGCCALEYPTDFLAGVLAYIHCYETKYNDLPGEL